MQILFDIDGCLASTDDRIHFLKEPKKNWSAFFADMKNDKPIEPICELCSQLMGPYENTVFFVTGRPEKFRQITQEWLSIELDFDLSYFNETRLLMRPDKDNKKDNELKLELLNKIRAMGYNPTLAFEDRDRNVEMYRKEGLICCQTMKGDF
jgi:hypothetical protein